jgi:hypothetical protein
MANEEWIIFSIGDGATPEALIKIGIFAPSSNEKMPKTSLSPRKISGVGIMEPSEIHTLADWLNSKSLKRVNLERIKVPLRRSARIGTFFGMAELKQFSISPPDPESPFYYTEKMEFEIELVFPEGGTYKPAPKK